MTDWQPIETAPKDGTNIILWLAAPYSSYEISHWDWQLEKWVTPDEASEIGWRVPSHWMHPGEPK